MLEHKTVTHRFRTECIEEGAKEFDRKVRDISNFGGWKSAGDTHVISFKDGELNVTVMMKPMSRDREF